jgi:hypothetical protein
LAKGEEAWVSKYAGSCLCGAVRFEIDGAFEGFFLCHCSRCRKGTGSAHAANLFAANASIAWLAGEVKVKTYSVEGTRHQKSFCVECGSAAPRVHASGGLVVPAGSLDTPLEMRPNAHVCYGSRASWDERLDDVPKLDGLPG